MKIIKTKNLNKINKFDYILVSFPSRRNFTNLLLASIIEELKPELFCRFVFTDFPITIISNKEFYPPSIDFYYKKIKNNKFLFVIGNYRPREPELYKKLYDIMKKGEEIFFLNEFSKEEGDVLFFRKEYRKSKINLEILKDKTREISNALIKGFPPFLFDYIKRDKKNVTFLFFNSENNFLYAIDVLAELLGEETDYSKVKQLFKKIKKEEKNLGYIG
jgi:hypothetical protein